MASSEVNLELRVDASTVEAQAREIAYLAGQLPARQKAAVDALIDCLTSQRCVPLWAFNDAWAPGAVLSVRPELPFFEAIKATVVRLIGGLPGQEGVES